MAPNNSFRHHRRKPPIEYEPPSEPESESSDEGIYMASPPGRSSENRNPKMASSFVTSVNRAPTMVPYLTPSSENRDPKIAPSSTSNPTPPSSKNIDPKIAPSFTACPFTSSTEKNYSNSYSDNDVPESLLIERPQIGGLLEKQNVPKQHDEEQLAGKHQTERQRIDYDYISIALGSLRKPVEPGEEQKETNVIRGFGDFDPPPPKDKDDYAPVPFRAFPPAANDQYWLTSEGHDPKFHVDKSHVIKTMPSRIHLAITESLLRTQPKPKILEIAEKTTELCRASEIESKRRRTSQSKSGEEDPLDYGPSPPLPPPRVVTGKIQAQDGARAIMEKMWNTGPKVPSNGPNSFKYATTSKAQTARHGSAAKTNPPETHGYQSDEWGTYSKAEEIAEFKKSVDDTSKFDLQGKPRSNYHLLIPPVIDTARMRSQLDSLEYCKKCGESHIPPGASITLPERDTCGSMLPDWFPSDDYAEPWVKFTQIINEIVNCDEQQRTAKFVGTTKAAFDDKKYHPDDRKWLVIHRRAGWWKCRSGQLASDPERACELCHNFQSFENLTAPGPGTAPYVNRKKELMDWISERMHEIGLEDRALGEEVIRRMEHGFGFSSVPHTLVPQEELDGYETGNDSDPDGERDLEELFAREAAEGFDASFEPITPELHPTLPRNNSLASLNLEARDMAAEEACNTAPRSPYTPALRGLFGRDTKRSL